MDIYFKENTGIQTPQERNLDYFKIIKMGADFQSSTAFAEVLFYEYLEDAQNNKVANAHRGLSWALGDSVDINAGYLALLNFENATTTSNDTVTFKGAVKQ